MTARLGQLLGHHHIEVPPIISRALKRLELPRRYLTDEQLVDQAVGPTGVFGWIQSHVTTDEIVPRITYTHAGENLSASSSRRHGGVHNGMTGLLRRLGPVLAWQPTRAKSWSLRSLLLRHVCRRVASRKHKSCSSSNRDRCTPCRFIPYNRL
jgi:hypothetical protein